jgi:hypothetical protein
MCSRPINGIATDIKEDKQHMVNVNKLKARMVLMGHTQKTLAAEMTDRGVKTSENTLSSKMNGKSQFDCVDADVICEILEVTDPADRAEIFLA